MAGRIMYIRIFRARLYGYFQNSGHRPGKEPNHGYRNPQPCRASP
nr:MAG TPA: hypothetical protein [Bacteriophage sp.]